MPIEGFKKENCRRRSKITAARGKVEAVPITFATNFSVPDDQLLSSWGELPGEDQDDRALEMINGLLPAGSKELTKEDVWIHRLEAASDEFISDRYGFLTTSTLTNIAKGGAKGVSFMNSHRTGAMSTPSELPFGKTFAGRYEAIGQGNGKTRERALLGIYLLKGVKPNGDNGPSTDDLHRMIDGGQLADVSVGLQRGLHGEVLCDVCGGDYVRCAHSAGTTREMSDEQMEAQRGRGVPKGRASYSLDNFDIGEISGVYDGAIAGAGFSKGFGLLSQFSEEQKEEFREAFRQLMDEDDEDPEDVPPIHKNSANGGGTDPKGTGKEPVDKRPTGERQHMLKQKLFSALKFMGLKHMAAAVMDVESDDEQALANAMSTQVGEEVEARLSKHPMLLTCAKFEITCSADVESLVERAKLGDKCVVDARVDAKKEAIRAFGEDKGPTIGLSVDNLPYAGVLQMRDAWQAQADATFGTKKEAPAGRQTAPAGTASADVKTQADTKPWDQLSEKEREYGIKMGTATPEAQDAFAKNLLAGKEVK